MRKILLILVASVSPVLGGACTRPVEADNPRLQNVQGVLFYRGLPFNGTMVSRHAHGAVKARTPFKHGARHGTERTWYENGRLSTEGVYVMGRKEGRHRGWHRNGNVQFYKSYRKDRFEGESWSWFDDGQVSSYFKVVDGKYLGYKRWRAGGKIYINYVPKATRRIGLYGGRLCNGVKSNEQGKTIAY